MFIINNIYSLPVIQNKNMIYILIVINQNKLKNLEILYHKIWILFLSLLTILKN
jgi:hypothetical protein